VRALNRILGTSLEPVYEAARPGEIQRIYLDAARAKRVLGWVPTTPLEDGLRRTVEWHRAAAI
jgi:nucleoside-diphosphate-sugar epimerase